MKLVIKNIIILKMPCPGIQYFSAVPILLHVQERCLTIGEAYLFRDGKAIRANISLEGDYAFSNHYLEPVIPQDKIVGLTVINGLPLLVKDKNQLERLEDIAKLLVEKQTELFNVMDAYLRDYKTSKAYHRK